MLLLWIGGLNWGLIALFDFNLVHSLFGPSSVTQLIYILVGAAAVYSFSTHNQTCNVCAKMGKGKKSKGKK